MVKEHLRIAGRDIRDERVLDAMGKVERHRFVPMEMEGLAYSDRPLPIGNEQTIYQPYIVALMTEVLRVEPSHRVLEIGTGSGYQAAVLGELTNEVYTVEIVESLHRSAEAVLTELGYRNVHLRLADGHEGWPEEAPFDAILVACAPERVPEALMQQLAIGGRMVVPVGRGESVQQLRLLERTEEGIRESGLIPVRFVPMTGGDGEDS